MLRRAILVLFLLISHTAIAETLDKIVAIVNNGVITENELNKQVDVLKTQMQASKMQIPDVVALRKQVLQHLIDQDLQMQVAKQANLTIEDKELKDGLKRIAESNKISLETLQSAVANQGMSWDSYRENIRREMLIGRLQQSAVGKSVQAVSEQQVQDYIKIHGTNMDLSKNTYHLQNMVIPLSDNPTDEQVKTAKQRALELLAKLRNGADFERLPMQESTSEFFLTVNDLGERRLGELPDIFAKEVQQMKSGGIAGPIRAGNGFQLIKLVSMKGETQHHSVIKTHVRHILLKNDTSLTQAEAMKQINNVYQQVKSGKDFALMAKQYSVDTATASKGGDLGWVNDGDVNAEFEKVMLKLPVNKVSRPVKTTAGWHLIQVLERKLEDDTEAYKKQQVRNLLQQKKFSEAIQNWQQHLRGNAYIQILDRELA